MPYHDYATISPRVVDEVNEDTFMVGLCADAAVAWKALAIDHSTTLLDLSAGHKQLTL